MKYECKMQVLASENIKMWRLGSRLGETDDQHFDKLSPRYRDEIRIVFYSMCHKIFTFPNLSAVNCYTIKWSDTMSW